MTIDYAIFKMCNGVNNHKDKMGCANSEHVPKPSISNRSSVRRSYANPNLIPDMQPAVTNHIHLKSVLSSAKSEEPERAPEPVFNRVNS